MEKSTGGIRMQIWKTPTGTVWRIQILGCGPGWVFSEKGWKWWNRRVLVNFLAKIYMSSYRGILVPDPWLHNQFTQAELRSLKTHLMSTRRESGKLVIADLASKMSNLKVVGENLSVEEGASHIQDL